MNSLWDPINPGYDDLIFGIIQPVGHTFHELAIHEERILSADNELPMLKDSDGKSKG